MSAEGRFLRIENALLTLVELAQKADERMTRHEESQRATDQRWERTEESIRSLLAIAEIHEREITTLGESQARLGEAHTRLGEAQAGLSESQTRLSESQAQTDERLKNLIEIVERYISERRNGIT